VLILANRNVSQTALASLKKYASQRKLKVNRNDEIVELRET
jgi:hypothetical protein